MKEIHTEIYIHAPAERVWSILTDFEAFPEWNPFLRTVRGDLGVGNRLEITTRMDEKTERRFRPEIVALVPGRELRWQDGLLRPWLFSSEHICSVEPDGDAACRFVNRETLAGVLAALMGGSLLRQAHERFEAMNRMLKARAEAPAVSTAT